MSKMSPAFPQKCNTGPVRVAEALYLGLRHLGLISIYVVVEKSTSLLLYKRHKRKGGRAMVNAVQPVLLRFLSEFIGSYMWRRYINWRSPQLVNDDIRPGTERQQIVVDRLVPRFGCNRDSSMTGFLSVYFRVSKLQHYWHFEPANSSLRGGGGERACPCIVECLEIKQPITQQMPDTASPPYPMSWHNWKFPQPLPGFPEGKGRGEGKAIPQLRTTD